MTRVLWSEMVGSSPTMTQVAPYACPTFSA
jgi:hypothetical protein